MKKTNNKSTDLVTWLTTMEELLDGVETFEQLCTKLGITDRTEKVALGKKLLEAGKAAKKLAARLAA